MDTTTIFVIAVAAAAVLVAIAVFAVAFRRSSTGDTGPVSASLDRRAIKADKAAAAARAEAAAGGGVAVATMTEVEGETLAEAEAAAHTDPLTTFEDEGVSPYEVSPIKRVEVTEEEFGITRRKFFNRAILGLFGVAFLGGLTISILAFMWPKLKGGFGTAITVGPFDEIFTQTQNPDGTISPVFLAQAQSWVVPFPTDEVAGSSFDGLPVVASPTGDGVGLTALWQRCVHLGCRVPSCEASQGFECPCHGSKYNFHGEYEDGPAPRNLDRFEVAVDGDGNLVINTGAIFSTPRAKNKTIAYPQGPSCL